MNKNQKNSTNKLGTRFIAFRTPKVGPKDRSKNTNNKT